MKEDFLRAFGAKHARALTSMLNLAGTYDEQWRHRHFWQRATRRTASLPHDNPFVRTSNSAGKHAGKPHLVIRACRISTLPPPRTGLLTQDPLSSFDKLQEGHFRTWGFKGLNEGCWIGCSDSRTLDESPLLEPPEHLTPSTCLVS